MADPKTISNLDVDVSTRWATDQELLKETRPILSDAAAIPTHTQKDVTLPASVPLSQQLFGINLIHPTWAAFVAPEGFNVQFRRLFTSSIAPSLGNDEQCEDKAAKIQAMTSLDPDGEEKRKTFIALFELLSKLNKDQIFAVSHINQYKKG